MIERKVQPTYTRCIRCEQGYDHLWHDDGTQASDIPPEWKKKDGDSRP